MRFHRGYLLTAALATAFAVPLWAHPLDEASIWIYKDGEPEQVSGSAMRTQPATAEKPAGRKRADGQAGSSGGRGSWTISIAERREMLELTFPTLGLISPTLGSDHLDWDAHMSEVRLNGNWQSGNGFTATGEMSYAAGFSGKMWDFYDYPSRISTKNLFSFGLGWRIMPYSMTGLTPLLGYTYQQHDLRAPQSNVGGFGFDMDAHHKAEWHGPWLGLRFDAHTGKGFDFHFTAKRQWFSYRADGELEPYNTRFPFDDTPIDFRQKGNSQGWKGEAGATWLFSPRHALALTLDWQKQRLRNGKSRTPDFPWLETKKDRMDWESWSIALGYRRNF